MPVVGHPQNRWETGGGRKAELLTGGRAKINLRSIWRRDTSPRSTALSAVLDYGLRECAECSMMPWSVYFADATVADALAARWCVGARGGSYGRRFPGAGG
jgi:hypothetical protein